MIADMKMGLEVPKHILFPWMYTTYWNENDNYGALLYVKLRSSTRRELFHVYQMFDQERSSALPHYKYDILSTYMTALQVSMFSQIATVLAPMLKVIGWDK